MSVRTAFVTSGASGLGYATVQAFLEAGWDVFFTYHRSEDKAQALLTLASNLGRRAECCKADLLSPEESLAAARQSLQKMQQVDAYIHNFGPFVFEEKALADYPDDLWAKMFDGNLNHFFSLYRFFAPHMKERQFGRIITVGFDGAGEAVGWRFRGPYAAAKSALASLTRTIAKEERENGITANMVCPGDIRGPHKAERIDDVLATSTLADRPPVGEDVARVVVFLADPHSGQINGTVTEVTGGREILHTNWNERS